MMRLEFVSTRTYDAGMTTSRHTESLGTIDSTELRILSVLAATGSLTAAATALGLSQPAISQRIKRIETRLAIPLIERHGRGIRLTPAGHILADHGRIVTNEIDAALAAIDELRGERGGTLRLVGFPSASATIVPAMMRKLATEAPNVVLQYHEAEPPEAIELLRNGEIDCAIIFDYAGAVELPTGSAFTPLWRETMSLVVTDDRVPDTGFAALSDYADDQWIAGCEKCRGHLLAATAECGFEPDIVQSTDNVPAMLAMAAAGGAIALVPDLALAAARTLPDDAVALPLDPPRHRTIGLLAMSTVNESPQVKLAKRMLSLIDGAVWNLQPVAPAVASAR